MRRMLTRQPGAEIRLDAEHLPQFEGISAAAAPSRGFEVFCPTRLVCLRVAETARLLVSIRAQVECCQHAQRVHHHEAGPGSRNVAHGAIESEAPLLKTIFRFEHALIPGCPAFAHQGVSGLRVLDEISHPAPRALTREPHGPPALAAYRFGIGRLEGARGSAMGTTPEHRFQCTCFRSDSAIMPVPC